MTRQRGGQSSDGARDETSAGGVVFRWRLTEAQTPDALLEAIAMAFHMGHRAFAVTYPAGYCEACGHASAPAESCPACDAPAASMRAIAPRRGYLAIES